MCGIRLVKRVCGDLGLHHGVDPLMRESLHGGVRYFRLIGRIEGKRIDAQHMYSDSELSDIAAKCEGKPSYVFFSNRSSWADALRLQAIVDPIQAALTAPRKKRKAWARYRG